MRYSKDRRRVISYQISDTQASLLARRRPSPDIEPERKWTKNEKRFLQLLADFERIDSYATTGDLSSHATFDLPDVRLKRYFATDLTKCAKLIRSRSRSDLFVTHSLDIEELQTHLDRYMSAKRHSYAVRQAIFSGLVSSFDELLSALIRTMLRERPDIIKSMKQTVAIEDVVNASDFQQFQTGLIENIVKGISAETRSEQFRWLEKYAGSPDIKTVLKSYSRFIEVCERRNLYIHNDGRVSEDYIARILKVGLKPEKDLGQRLPIGQAYFREAADALLEAYVLVSQSCIRSLNKSASRSFKEETDTIYNNCVYEQIKSKRFESGIRLAEMLLADNSIKDLARRMTIVNKAIAYDKMGRQKERDATLDSIDWTSAMPEFSISIAAIKGDVAEVCRLIPRLVESELLDVNGYYSWLAFDNVRHSSEFWEKLTEVYGEEVKSRIDQGLQLEIPETPDSISGVA